MPTVKKKVRSQTLGASRTSIKLVEEMLTAWALMCLASYGKKPKSAKNRARQDASGSFTRLVCHIGQLERKLAKAKKKPVRRKVNAK